MEFSLKSIDLNIFGNEFTLESYLPKTCNTDVYLKYIEYELSSMLRDEIINYFNGCRYNLLFDLSIHEDIKKRASFRFLKNDIDLYSKLDEKANHIVNFIEEQYPHIFNKKIGYMQYTKHR